MSASRNLTAPETPKGPRFLFAGKKGAIRTEHQWDTATTRPDGFDQGFQERLNEVALPSAAATDASRVVISGQCSARNCYRIPNRHIPRKCPISKQLQFKSHSNPSSGIRSNAPIESAPASGITDKTRASRAGALPIGS